MPEKIQVVLLPTAIIQSLKDAIENLQESHRLLKEYEHKAKIDQLQDLRRTVANDIQEIQKLVY